MTLTVKAVDAAKPREKGYKLASSADLYPFMTPAGSKSWRAHMCAMASRPRAPMAWDLQCSLPMPAARPPGAQGIVAPTFGELPTLGTRPITEIKRAELVAVVRDV
ncbi:hypothetical protein [Verminephrobacter aporrectodeae]|uniref:hypothetical protein n=1 Tax=Verminephrobacter aporrectodeae TaxID=1110389 RepID=UPI002243E8F8|nr:hypothetical protein [Verminephrobacter aporrectodeae]